jgi:hypothetical protein
LRKSELAQAFRYMRGRWLHRLVCSRCGSRNVDMVVTGARRSPGI